MNAYFSVFFGDNLSTFYSFHGVIIYRLILLEKGDACFFSFEKLLTFNSKFLALYSKFNLWKSNAGIVTLGLFSNLKFWLSSELEE